MIKWQIKPQTGRTKPTQYPTVTVTKPGIARSKRDGTRAETRFGLSAKRTNPFKSAGVSVQSTAGSEGVRISGQQLYRPCSDVQCKASGYQLHSHLSPSLPRPSVAVCHQVLNALYRIPQNFCPPKYLFFFIPRKPYPWQRKQRGSDGCARISKRQPAYWQLPYKDGREEKKSRDISRDVSELFRLFQIYLLIPRFFAESFLRNGG